MPSRAYTSFLHVNDVMNFILNDNVSMPSRAYTSFLLYKSSCREPVLQCVNALSGLYLISTVPLQKPRFYAVSRAYFCRYLSEYSDRSSFSCMFTIWTYLTRQIFPNSEFTIAQNYSSVILFFHLYSL